MGGFSDQFWERYDGESNIDYDMRRLAECINSSRDFCDHKNITFCNERELSEVYDILRQLIADSRMFEDRLARCERLIYKKNQEIESLNKEIAQLKRSMTRKS